MAKILDTKTSRTGEPVMGSPAFSLISEEKLVAIYAAMVKCRMLQQRAAVLFQQGKLDADLHTSAGREACAAAFGVDLQSEDTLSIAPGDWLPAFLKGLPAEIIFRALATRMNGFPATVPSEIQKRNILESQTNQPAAVRGQAETLQAERKAGVVVAFFERDSAWQKVVAAAGAKKLPIVFVQHVGDGASKVTSSPSPSKTPQSVFRGVPAIAVEAADPVALYRVAYEAITRARQGRGATLLECAAIPLIDSKDPSANQPLQPQDALANMETYLKNKGIEPEPCNRQLVSEFTRDLDLATRFLAS